MSRGRRQRGFTLAELLIVLAIVAILSAVVVPNVGSFISRGKERAHITDGRILQAAVDAYRTDVGARVGNPWPTLGKVIGEPSSTVNSYIDIKVLADGKYIDSPDAIRSSDTNKNTTAENFPSGSYGWYLDSAGRVKSSPPYNAKIGYP